MTIHLNRIRFGPERDLIDLLFDRFGLAAILDHFETAGEVIPYWEYILGTQLRLTPLLAPRLIDLLTEVCARLGFTEPIDLFVQESSEINGFSLHSMRGRPHVISVNSGMVERMNDCELKFVLGHEVGHLAYGHYRSRLVPVALGEDTAGQSRVPPLLARRLASWDRQAELSADRAGFLAANGDLEQIVSAFFKMVAGLGPEHLRFDLTAFLEQLEDLQKLERGDVLNRFSHPATPVRVRAMQLFHLAGGADATDEQLAEVDLEVAAIACLMDQQVGEPIEVKSRDFLVAAGLLAAQLGGTEVDRQQADLLLHLVLPMSADPEAEFARIQTPEQAEALLAESTGWLKNNAGEERFALFDQLAHVVTVDGELSDVEQQWMVALAIRLSIPESRARETLFEALGAHLQTQASMKRPKLGFGINGATGSA